MTNTEKENTMNTTESTMIASAIEAVFQSPNELDSNWEAANIVDALFVHARAIHRLAAAVERFNPREGDDR